MSGAHSMKTDWDNQVDLELKKKTDMFLYHGEADPMVPVELTIKSYEIFKEKGLKFTFEKEHDLEHSLSLPEIKKLSKFFNSRMQ